MDKGIRPFCNAKFRELLPQRAQLGNTEFRRAVMNSLIENFGCSLASAATHYNHSFKVVKTENAALVEGLGRADDKKGGRKKKQAVAAPTQAVPMLLLTYTPAVVLHSVVKAKDGTVVAENLTLADAEALVAKAAAAKKAKLQIV